MTKVITIYVCMHIVMCKPWVYILELKDECWYVGSTTRTLAERLGEHSRGRTAEWVKLHKWTGRYVAWQVPIEQEKLVTMAMMRMVGKDKVRGGCWVRTEPLKSNPHLEGLYVSCIGVTVDLCGNVVWGNRLPHVGGTVAVHYTDDEDDGDVMMKT